MSKKEANEKLTESQVWDVIEFARGLASDISWLHGGGTYTPQTLHQNLVKLNHDGLKPSYEKICKALGMPVENVNILKGFCQTMEYMDSLFNKVLEYKANVLSFDLAWACKNAKGSQYKSKEYKEDFQRVQKFLFNFDYKKVFKDIVKNLLRSGVYYCWFREGKETADGEQKYALQMLPQNRCIVTGDSNLCSLFDIDLTFLMSGTVDIDLYAPIFGKYYNELFDPNSQRDYIPSNHFCNRHGSWGFWVQTSPSDKAWCFRYDTSKYTNVPPLAAFLKDTILQGDIQKLQYDKDMIGAYGILSGEIKMKKTSAQGNDFAIDPKLLGELLSLVQSGLGSNIKVGAVPLENQKFFQYEDKNEDMYKDAVKVASGIGASASRIIYSDDKASEAELIAQITADSEPLVRLYKQFEAFLNYFINKKTKRYKFSFSFKGLNYWFDKEDRREAFEHLVDRGVVPNLTYFAQAYGFNPHELANAVDEGAHGVLPDMLSQLISIHTASVGEDKGGRPRSKRGNTTSTEYREDRRKN